MCGVPGDRRGEIAANAEFYNEKVKEIMAMPLDDGWYKYLLKLLLSRPPSQWSPLTEKDCYAAAEYRRERRVMSRAEWDEARKQSGLPPHCPQCVQAGHCPLCSYEPTEEEQLGEAVEVERPITLVDGCPHCANCNVTFMVEYS